MFYDHKTLCHILHIFLTRSMQTSSIIVVETIPWPSIMIVATMNGISAPNFTMNAMKFHITMLRKLASATLPLGSTLVMQYFSCASLPCYSKALLTTQAQSLQIPRDRVVQQCWTWLNNTCEIAKLGNKKCRNPWKRGGLTCLYYVLKLTFLLYRRMFLNIERNF